MFKIIKKGSNNFWHVFNNGAKNVSISDFEVVLDDVLNTFVIVLRNGANIPQIALSVLDIIVIDETGSSVEETFLTASQLRARLVVLGYTAYLGAGNADSITGLIDAGTNVTITGTGTLADPYIINSSSGSGTTPTLQEVTTEGNVTDIPIILDNVGMGVELSSSLGRLAFKQLAIGSGFNAILAIDDLTTESIYVFKDGGGTIAFESDIPTTPDDIGALAFNGSNASADVDLGIYNLLAKRVVGESIITRNTDETKNVILKATNVTTSRNAEWQDKDYTGVADITDIPDVSAKEDTSNKSSSYTASSTTTYANTKALVDGLATKQSLLSYTPYKFIQTSQTAHTGTTAETIVATATINGGTFNASDVMKALYGLNKGTTTSGVQLRLKINTSNTLTGAVQIAQFNTTGTASVTNFKRNFMLNGGNLYGFNFTNTAIVSDEVNNATTYSSTTYNTANTLYFFFTIQLLTSSDSVTPNLFNLTN
jgi:hypothetical protein